MLHNQSFSVDIFHHLAVLHVCCPLLYLQEDCTAAALLHTKHPRKHQQSHLIALFQFFTSLTFKSQLLLAERLSSHISLLPYVTPPPWLVSMRCLLAHACIANSQAEDFDICTAPPSGPRLEFQDTLEYSK